MGAHSSHAFFTGSAGAPPATISFLCRRDAGSTRFTTFNKNIPNDSQSAASIWHKRFGEEQSYGIRQSVIHGGVGGTGSGTRQLVSQQSAGMVAQPHESLTGRRPRGLRESRGVYGHGAGHTRRSANKL